MYNFKTGLFGNSLTLKRRLLYNNILGIAFEPEYDRIVIHGKNSEYDHYYKIKNIKQVVAYIEALYEFLTNT